MNDDTPQTRAEARSLEYETLEPITYEGELITEEEAFLPLPFRRVLYVLSLAGAVVAPVLAVSQPDYAAAIVTAAGVLTVASAGTALANPKR